MSSSSSSSDEQLDRAVAELRQAHDDGPSPPLKARTLAGLRRAARRRSLNLVLRIAAAVAVGACGIAVYLAVSRGRPPVVAGPDTPPPVLPPLPSTRPDTAPSDPRPVPQTTPVEPGEKKLVHAPPPPPPPPPLPPARRPVEPQPRVVPAGNWSIAGTVRFEGEAPEPQQVDVSPVKECAAQHPDGLFDESLVVTNGTVANVVVFVRFANDEAVPAPPPPREPAVLDQRGCRYRPHVLAMRVGQQLVVTNNDSFLHNVHALSVDNPAFNFGQPSKDPLGRKVEAMKTAEVFKVKCDVHPWMTAYVHVIDHPYFAVTKEDGSFAIPRGLPDGQYTLVAWHERLGEQQARVEVNGGRAAGADFAFRVQ